MAVREKNGGRDSVKVSIMGFAQPVFISAALQKYIRIPPFNILKGWGITCYRRLLWSIFFAVCFLILLLFSFSSCQTVTLSSVRANYYGNAWNGYQIFFFFYISSTHMFASVNTCWWVLRSLSLSAWFSWQPSLLLVPIHIKTIISDTSLWPFFNSRRLYWDCVSEGTAWSFLKSLLCLLPLKERRVHVALTMIPKAPCNVFHQTC